MRPDRSTASSPPAPDTTFRVLFERESRYVWHTLRRLGVLESDLEDVTHEVFLTVHRKLSEYDPARPIRPWLFGIAFRYATRYRQLARHRRELKTEDLEMVDETPGADEQLGEHQRRLLFRQALEAVDMEQRAVFIMHDMDGIPMKDVADVLGVPLNTAYSRRRLAREALEQALHRLKLKRGIA